MAYKIRDDNFLGCKKLLYLKVYLSPSKSQDSCTNTPRYCRPPPATTKASLSLVFFCEVQQSTKLKNNDLITQQMPPHHVGTRARDYSYINL
jgi:hypothetical protein